MASGLRGRMCPVSFLVLACLAVQAFSSSFLLRLSCLFVGGLALLWLCLRARDSEDSVSGKAGAEEELISASHDLRQPVQAIALFAASLSAYPLPETVRKLVSGIEEGAQSLSGMLEAVFGLAKLRVGKLTSQSRPVALEESLAHAVADKLDLAQERELHLRHAPTSAWVQADPALLSQALSCLLRQALVKAEGGILLGGRRRGAEVWIELRHAGSVGLSFSGDTFVPAEGVCDILPDKGYGLAYANGLVRLMGGRLEMRAGERGCLFRLVLKAAMPGA